MKRFSFISPALLVLGLMAGANALAANIVIVNGDGAGEGFNDLTTVSPVGGNFGATVGEQRLEVFRRAAEIWNGLLGDGVDIQVDAKFDPLSCDASSAVLGSAGTNTVHSDFEGALRADTWYPQALANHLAGTDLAVGTPDIGMTFNGNIDDNDACLSGTSWYLGLDGDNGADIDLVNVVLHEIGHGLGFATYVNESNGARLLQRDDIFMTWLEDHSTQLLWPQMTDSQRQASAIDSGDLHFVGPMVQTVTGHAPVYAPNPTQPGSSVSHFDTTFSTPNELMEPFITNPPLHDPGLALELMFDLGWSDSTGTGNPPPSGPPTAPSDVSATNLANGQARVNWTGEGSDTEAFDILRESPHKRRPGIFVGSTLVATVNVEKLIDGVGTYDDASGAGSFRYCVRAASSGGTSDFVCSEVISVTDSGSGDGGGGGGGFCSSRPNHKRC
ncbi:MAG: hypothetical protein ACI8PT_001451 [Gammaproteobacteria bacterium]|jgi:hypothetical protein